MNDSKNSSNGLLVLKLKSQVSDECIADLMEVIRPTADALDVEPMVLPAGVDVELHTGTHALLERVCVALEEIAAQGRVPEVSEAQIAPQALNARAQENVDTFVKALNAQPGLNQRPPPRNPGPEFNGLNGNGYQPTVNHGVEGMSRPPKER